MKSLIIPRIERKLVNFSHGAYCDFYTSQHGPNDEVYVEINAPSSLRSIFWPDMLF